MSDFRTFDESVKLHGRKDKPVDPHELTNRDVAGWSRAVKIRDGFFVYLAYSGDTNIHKGWELDAHIMPRVRKVLEEYAAENPKPPAE